MRVAVLGTGTMGAGMAQSLARSGHTVTAWNRTAEKALPLRANGITVTTTVWSAVQDAEVIITMAFDARATLDLAARFLGAVPEGAVWMQCATVGPDGMRWIADLAAQYEVDLVDAPVVGSKQPAADGTLVALVSGKPALVERIQPVLDGISSKTIVAGDSLGRASALKLACNAWVASLTAATAQSVTMCQQLGVDPALFLEAIDGGAANSPYAQTKGEMMIAGHFEPSFAVDGLLKDIGLMIDAVDPDTSPLLPVLRGAFGAASAGGHGRDDIAAVVASFA
jgi:3-hydroxyisobutyrate dehydrogenase